MHNARSQSKCAVELPLPLNAILQVVKIKNQKTVKKRSRLFAKGKSNKAAGRSCL